MIGDVRGPIVAGTGLKMAVTSDGIRQMFAIVVMATYFLNNPSTSCQKSQDVEEV